MDNDNSRITFPGIRSTDDLRRPEAIAANMNAAADALTLAEMGIGARRASGSASVAVREILDRMQVHVAEADDRLAVARYLGDILGLIAGTKSAA